MLLSKAYGRLVSAGLLAALLTVCEGATSCPTGLPPAGLTLGLNDGWRGQALYRLDVGRAKFGYRPHHYYKLDITSSNNDLPFSDAVITLKEEDPDKGCGIGHFQFDTDDLFQYSGCRSVILTNKKQPMTQLPPFSWKAPGCGCIIVNATVIRSGSTYYMDQTHSQSVLSKRICRMQTDPSVRKNKIHTIQATQATKLPQTLAPVKTRKIQKMSRTDRMDLLCQISFKYNGAALLAREVFLRRREISSLNMTSLIRLEMALDQRRGDIHECCKMSSNTERSRCFDNKRRRRIDRFCRVGVPDIPFTARRAAFMKEKETECCWKLGEHRYRCFGQKSRPVPGKGEHSVEYSQDEMDPVNDIGDYPSEIDEIAKDVDSYFFVDDARKDAVITVHETLTFTSPKTKKITTTTKTTTTTTTTTPTTTAQASASQPNNADWMLRRTLTSGVVSDDTMATEEPTKIATRGSTKKSSVDEELEVLSLKKWKLETKLACCRKGKSVGESIDIQQGIYNHCRHQWRKYRKSLRKGRNMCMNKFMECCVDEAGIHKNHDVTISKTLNYEIRIPLHNNVSTTLKFSIKKFENKLSGIITNLGNKIRSYKMVELLEKWDRIHSKYSFAKNISKSPNTSLDFKRDERIHDLRSQNEISDIDISFYSNLNYNHIPDMVLTKSDTMVTKTGSGKISTPIMPGQHINSTLGRQRKPHTRGNRIRVIRVHRRNRKRQHQRQQHTLRRRRS